ncbi:MAG TPA: ATP-binding protein [Kofleriaceae bacterium]|jgi:signal transduction histidine kinase
MDAQRRKEIAVHELGRRLLTGTLGYVAMFVAAVALVGYAFHVTLAVLALAVIVPLRTYAWWSATRHPGRCRNIALLWVGILSAHLLWGLLVLEVELDSGVGTPSVVFMVFAAGITSGGVYSMAPSAWLHSIAVTLLVGPIVVAGVLGYGTTEFAIIHAIFVFYSLANGRVARESFWREVATQAQLRTQNGQLRDEMEQRQKMEIELREAQKLEAIGRLAAGVAHEINTPLQYVSDSCRFLLEGVGNTDAALAKYHALVTAEHAAPIVEEHDLEYLRENLHDAAQRAIEGLDRVTTIVRAMKQFSHQATERTPANLNAALEDTLVVCRNEIKDVADVVTELGDLPLVLCNAAELNQVFLNIIVNAAHAVADTQKRGTITITTQSHDEHVRIAISDTGPGIPAHVIDKIYEPFFTTKPVGKGSGQGLAIARSIVVGKHGGELDVRSASGVGTTFTIRLPVAA